MARTSSFSANGFTAGDCARREPRRRAGIVSMYQAAVHGRRGGVDDRRGAGAGRLGWSSSSRVAHAMVPGAGRSPVIGARAEVGGARHVGARQSGSRVVTRWGECASERGFEGTGSVGSPRVSAGGSRSRSPARADCASCRGGQGTPGGRPVPRVVSLAMAQHESWAARASGEGRARAAEGIGDERQQILSQPS